MPSRSQRPPSPPPPPDPYDGVELSDEDLEMVVGGLDPEYFLTQAAHLQQLWGLKPPEER